MNMEGEQQHHYELRSRSRSRSHTPMVSNQTPGESELTDHHYELRSRSRDRSHTPGEVTSSRRSGTRSLPSSAGKQRDKSMEIITEQKEDTKTDMTTDQHSRRSESTTSSATRKVERRSERQRVKRQIFSNGQSEMNEDSSANRTEEKVKRKSITPKRIITSDYSSEEGEKEDPPSRPGSAYEIYKQAGDWWNVFPKTDYTYSQKSQFRYEIAPGVLAMPNMSRPSIHSDGNSTTGSVNSLSQQNLSQYSRGTRESFGEERSYDEAEARDTIEQNRLNEMSACRLFAQISKEDAAGRSVIYRKTHVEQYNSHREIIYEDSGSSLRRHRYGVYSPVDSDTELDDAVSLKYSNRQQKWRVTEWMQTIRHTVIMWLSSGLDFVKVKVLRRGNVSASHDYRRYRESKWKKAWAPIDRLMQYLYLLLVRILFLDTWLLSRVSTARQQLKERRSKLLWLILLPPLLLAGLWFLSCARDTVSPLLVAQHWPRYDTVMSDKIIDRAEYIATPKVRHQIDKQDQGHTDNKEIKRFMENLANRVEKLEAAETLKVDRLANITKAVEEVRNTDKNVWERYDDKIQKIEKSLDERATNNFNEIDAIKLEFQSLRDLYGRLKSCCDTSARLANGEEIEKLVEQVMAGYFGTGVSKQKLNRIVESLIIASDKNFNKIVNSEANAVKNNDPACPTPTPMSDEDMRRIVNEVLKIYDADKTGRVDYALESAGGQIISTRCTQRYNVNTRAFKLLGFTLYYESNNPRTVIQGSPLQPGACWAFQDFPGYLLIKLRSFIKITGFTVEHVPRSILPNSEMRSAPRKFNVWGLKDENDAEPVLFGDYEFLDSDESLQYFPIQNTDITVPYEYAELRIHSNHGQLEYTCLYRFRVHGIPG